MNHPAIYKAYPNAVRIDEGLGVFDAEGNLIEIDDSLVTKAAIAIENEEKAKLAEQTQKKAAAEAKLKALGLTIEDLKALGIG